MGSYRDPIAWLAQSVLGNSRPVRHVRYLLDHATTVDGKLVSQAPGKYSRVLGISDSDDSGDDRSDSDGDIDKSAGDESNSD